MRKKVFTRQLAVSVSEVTWVRILEYTNKEEVSFSSWIRKSGTWVQRQLINADDSVLIIFRITIHLFFGRSNSPSSSR